jgi:hypothetical protein
MSRTHYSTLLYSFDTLSISASFHHFSKKLATISGVPIGLGPAPPNTNNSAIILGVRTSSLAISLILSMTPWILFS